MKKRKIRLGSSSEAHVKGIEEEHVVGMNIARGGEASLKKGRCDRALGELATASTLLGGMFTHIKALPGRDRARYDKDFDAFARRLEALRFDLAKKCFIQGGKN